MDIEEMRARYIGKRVRVKPLLGMSPTVDNTFLATIVDIFPWGGRWAFRCEAEGESRFLMADEFMAD